MVSMDESGNKSPKPTHNEIEDVNSTNKTIVNISRCLMDALPATTQEGQKQANGLKEPTDSVLQKLGLHDHMLNPSSPSFDFQEWSRTLVRLRSHLNVPTPPRSGFTFKNLTVHGSSSGIKHQDTVWTLLTFPLNFRAWFRPKQTKTILQGLDGVVHKGELLLVLGRPGSGCSTFLKTITGQMRGLDIDSDSGVQYTGVPHRIMTREFQGELIYNGEVDEHLPYLTVGQTLEFAAAMRVPRARMPGITRKDRVKHVVQVMLTVFGLSHTRNTIVGNDYVRGVSGGERKRVSIAETALSEAAISAWDNSTKGLDAESALQFVSRLRTLSDLTQSSNAAAIYQSSQAIYDLFDKILVLYQGREIFFGYASSAPAYFERMGWHRHPRQTSGDYLTTITDPEQRVAKEGHEDTVPRTPEEFNSYWVNSPEYASLMKEIDQCHKVSDLEQETTRKQFEAIRHNLKAKGMLRRATQTVSFPMQTILCVKRSMQQLWNDKGSTLTTLVGEVIIALVVGSIFFGTPDTTDAFFSYGSVLFFSVLLNVLMSVTDIHNLYRGRSVITKQVSYAFYRPSADALASVLVDIPVKFIIGVFFNVILYFLAGLALSASQFFIFFLFVYMTTLAMSMVFRTIAAATSTLAQAMALSGILVLALVTYTGFVLPSPYMHPWFKWISYINPLAYAFEALLVNQAHGTNYPCSSIVPSYPNLVGDTFDCPVPGSVAGQTYVNGDAWFETSYDYSYSHLWRNLGIIIGFLVFFLLTYLIISDLNVNSSASADTLVFLDDHRVRSKVDMKLKGKVDVEQPLVVNNAPVEVAVVKGTAQKQNQSVFAWRKLNFDVMIKGESRRLLDGTCGWVKPGSMIALMGVSGAGKTTLLNALAQRMPAGQVKGEFFVDGRPLPPSFKSNVGYVQQQDVHLETSTVREALQFSAMLRQPRDVPMRQKLQFAEETIHLLGMGDFADAIIGLPGNGLNAEQRKRLSIGVELAGKPSLLLFLDEPTSGLDSQSSEAILALLRRLAGGGLGILCTIHQPSAMLFQRFDRLLLMARGGKVAYFGDIGKDSDVVIRYFDARAPRKCKEAENPAEYILEMIGNTDSQDIDWPGLWNESTEASTVSTELENVSRPSSNKSVQDESNQLKRPGSYPLPLRSQLPIVCRRVFQQYWRSTTYIASKFMLGISGTLFIGFSFFQPGQSILGIQNAIFSILMICAMFSSLVQQIMPKFIMQRTIYEVREKHSNMYSWVVLILSNILVEIPYHLVLGVVTFAIFNYTVFGIRSSEDQGLVLLFFTYFYMLIGTFAIMITAPLPDATTAGRITTVLFSMMLLFAGVFQTPTALPGFWIFMYRVSPMTYLVGGVAVSGLSGNSVVCSQSELAIFQPPARQTCGSYMRAYLEQGASGTLLNPGATSNCSYCPLKSADQILALSEMYYDDRWRDWALGFAYIFFNISATFLFYALARLGLFHVGVEKVTHFVRRRRTH